MTKATCVFAVTTHLLSGLAWGQVDGGFEDDPAANWHPLGLASFPGNPASGNHFALLQEGTAGHSRIYQAFNIPANAQFLWFRYQFNTTLLAGKPDLPPDSFIGQKTERDSSPPPRPGLLFSRAPCAVAREGRRWMEGPADSPCPASRVGEPQQALRPMVR